MEAPPADAPAEDAAAEEARGSDAKAQAVAPEGDWIVFGGQYYILAPANDPAHPAGEEGDGEARGAQLGTVDDSSDGALIGCAVYALSLIHICTSASSRMSGVSSPSARRQIARRTAR